MLKSPTKSTESIAADLKKAELLVREMAAIYMSDANIHSQTRKLGDYCRDFFFPIDQKYRLSKPRDLKEVASEILMFAQGDRSVKAALDSILGARGIERETGINPQELLVRTWSLVCASNSSDLLKGVIFDNLKHNRANGGGCLAGITARLLQPYTLLVKEGIENALILSLSDNDKEDDLLQAALLVSLAEKMNVADEAPLTTTLPVQPVILPGVSTPVTTPTTSVEATPQATTTIESTPEPKKLPKLSPIMAKVAEMKKRKGM